MVDSISYIIDNKIYNPHNHTIHDTTEVLMMLENEEDLPEELKAHKLTGQYKDCMECHIEGDFLLIWLDDESDGKLTELDELKRLIYLMKSKD